MQIKRSKISRNCQFKAEDEISPPFIQVVSPDLWRRWRQSVGRQRPLVSRSRRKALNCHLSTESRTWSASRGHRSSSRAGWCTSRRVESRRTLRGLRRFTVAPWDARPPPTFWRPAVLVTLLSYTRPQLCTYCTVASKRNTCAL